MQRGWKAKGHLTPLYRRFGGVAGLAKVAGVPQATLSQINGGSRNLGDDVAARLIDATGVTLLELGAPHERLAQQDTELLPLARLQAQIDEERRRFDSFAEGVLLRLDALEEGQKTRGHQSGRRRGVGR